MSFVHTWHLSLDLVSAVRWLYLERTEPTGEDDSKKMDNAWNSAQNAQLLH